jgi:hypothetical protein
MLVVVVMLVVLVVEVRRAPAGVYCVVVGALRDED